MRKSLTFIIIIGVIGLVTLGCHLIATSSAQYDAWVASAHAQSSDEAFVHWDEDDPAEIPTSCARCHSSEGFQDFIADGSVDDAVALPLSDGENNVDCLVCHDSRFGGDARAVTSVTFPSGVEITGLGTEAICMQCHQGRASGSDVDADTAGIGEDTVSDELGFINIHYYAAGATLYGTDAGGGYEYTGNTYSGFNTHVAAANSCVECHDSHSLEVIVTCSTAGCHPANGDLDAAALEITNAQTALYAEIQTYASTDAGQAIVYDSASYPYFFIDTNTNGAVDAGEAIYPNRYVSWTPRLLKAAYNYQISKKDPGAYAHNKAYIVELLNGSIADLPY